MRAVPFSEATAADDKKIFSRICWQDMNPDGEEASRDDGASQQEFDLNYVLERISTFYMRSFDRDLPSVHPARLEKPFSHYLSFCRHMSELHRSIHASESQLGTA